MRVIDAMQTAHPSHETFKNGGKFSLNKLIFIILKFNKKFKRFRCILKTNCDKKYTFLNTIIFLNYNVINLLLRI